MQQLHAGQMIGVRPNSGGLATGASGMNMSSMQGMAPMQGGSAPPDARGPNDSDGYGFGPLGGPHLQDETPHSALLIDELGYTHWNGGHAYVIDGQAWYGNNFNKLWLKFEGDRADGRWQDLRTEVLWDHAATAFWDTQLGIRHDFGVGPGRNWLAFGIEGLAPYFLDTEATFYIGPEGRTAVRFETAYDVRFTQRLILQPKIEINLYGKDDPRRGIGSGLSEVDLGLRLRYEMTREVAPYIGVVRVQRFGHTADFVHAGDGHANETRIVAGLHIWY